MPMIPETGMMKMAQIDSEGVMAATNVAIKALFDQWMKERDEDTSEARRLIEEAEAVEPFEGVTTEVFCKQQGIRVEKREVDFIASTPDQDSDGDIVEQDFVYDRFIKNPVILFAHNSRALPIGKASNVGVRDGVLKMTVTFASKKANPLAEQVFQLIKEDMLRAMSIGFIPRDIRRELRDDKEVWILSKNELIESSVVPIPANQNALAELKAKALRKHAPPSEPTNAADGGQENSMDVEQLQKDIAELTDAKEAMSKELEALKERYTSLEELRNEEKDRANKAELALVERDLDELVGHKISPKEKASLIKLAEANRELYDEQMKAINDRPDMNLREPSVLPAERPEPRALPAPDEKPGAAFARRVNRRAGLNK
jgi:HK97 family phage prohead protease